jgi:hypothetical protein
MKNVRKIITGLLVVTGLATAGAYAQPEGFWQGGEFSFTAQNMIAMGPGMMGYVNGPRGSYGPGMMGFGADPRSGWHDGSWL